MPITQESGGSAVDRAQEAQRIIVEMGLIGRVEDMSLRDRGFVERLADQLERYGDLCFVSPKQVFWLRDLAERHL